MPHCTPPHGNRNLVEKFKSWTQPASRNKKRRTRKRRLRGESLESRRLLAVDIDGFRNNTLDPEDVNNDGQVSSIDALMIVNAINRGNAAGDGDMFTDVNNDGRRTSLDALRVINRISRERGLQRRDPPNNNGQQGNGDDGNDIGGNNDGENEDVFGEVREIDGTGNNLDAPALGATGTELLRLTTVEYADGIAEPAGQNRPSAREVSNSVVAQTTTATNDRFLTDATWLFGQFIDHDIDLSESADPAESFDIEVPAGDIFFDPTGTGEAVISLTRTLFDEATGTSADNPRQQVNEITSFIDGSVIYGSDAERAAALRTFQGGRLATSEGDLLPFNEAGLANAGGTSEALFLAGDVRANENAALTAMHTLWVREHNFWAESLAADDPTLDDEQLYQAAKEIVTAELQAITYNEFLPALLGEEAIGEYSGYDSSVDPSIANVFSSAIYRFGHSMLSSELLRLENDGTTADEGNLSLQNAFFAPDEIRDNGIDSLLLGATAQVANEIDNQIVDDVRNFLFGPPGSGGFDLASLNIQRGRDHGLADYNQTREDVGLERVTTFSEITSDTELAAKLEELYGDVDNIDVWVGALAEDHVDGSSLGELATTVIADQFERIRDGDRFWYQNLFTGEQLSQIENTSLSDVIERNTSITGLRENVFFDSSVLRVELSDGRDATDVIVSVDASEVSVVAASSGELIEIRSLDDVSQIQIVGSDRGGQDISIDLSSADAAIAGGIVVNGSTNPRDSINLIGSDEVNAVTVDGNLVTVNGIEIDYAGIESIHWYGNPDNDQLTTIQEGEATFTIAADEDFNDRDQPRDQRDARRNDRDRIAANHDDETGPSERSNRGETVQSREGLTGLQSPLAESVLVDAAIRDFNDNESGPSIDLQFVDARIR
tara:strand:- start:96593 stop:99271 length:2679 start_codon:yes stop_codon:yes gene_type:complete